MEPKIYLSDYVFCTLKKQNETHRDETVKNLFVSAAMKGYKIMRLGDGFIASYDFAKSCVNKLRLHCSRFFSEIDLIEMTNNKLISQARFNALTGKE